MSIRSISRGISLLSELMNKADVLTSACIAGVSDGTRTDDLS